MNLADMQKVDQRPAIVSWIATLFFIVGFAGLVWLAKEIADDVSYLGWKCIGRTERHTGEVYGLASIFVSMIMLAFGLLFMRAWALWGLVLLTVITFLITVSRFYKTNFPLTWEVSFQSLSPIKSGLTLLLIVGLVLLLIFRKRYIPAKKITLIIMLVVLLGINFIPLHHIYYTRYPIGFYWTTSLEKVTALPPYPGAQNVTNKASNGNQYFMRGGIQRYTLDPTILIDDVRQYYADELTSRGWRSKERINNTLNNIYQKGGYETYVSISCVTDSSTRWPKSCSEMPGSVFEVAISLEKINRDPYAWFRQKFAYCPIFHD